MKKILVILTVALVLAGCAMFGSWKAIPPPGGCDQCHTKQISADWQVTVSPVTLTDETGTPSWQKPESVLAEEPSPLQTRKITEQRCFRCHKGPDKSHVEYRGRYHH